MTKPKTVEEILKSVQGSDVGDWNEITQAKKELLELILNHPKKPKKGAYESYSMAIRTYDNFLREVIEEK